MKVNIVSEKQNPYLKRKEILLSIEHEAESTPPKAAVLELLAKQLSAEKEKIEIVDIISETGLPKSKSMIFIWEEVPVKKIKKTAEKAEAPKEEQKEVKEKKKEEIKKEEPAKKEIKPEAKDEKQEAKEEKK